MKRFKKNIVPDRLQEIAATKIASGILQTHNRFAKLMHSLSRNWKPKQQWIFLCIVCLVFGGLSILAMSGAFQKSQPPTNIPMSIQFPTQLKPDKKYIITDTEFKQVKKFKHTHPEMLEQMPGLVDSLSLIEQIYLSQKTK